MSENKIEELNFEDVVNICADYIENFGNSDSMAKFEELKQKLVIRNFLEIQKKELIIKKILLDLSSAWSVTTYAGAIELALFFNGLLAYTNINPGISAGLKIPEVYNILHYTELSDYILSFCEKDYNYLMHMVERMISEENIERLIEALEDLDGENLENLNKQFEMFTAEDNLKTLKELGNILGYNDPLIKTIKDNVEEQAFESLNHIDTLNESK